MTEISTFDSAALSPRHAARRADAVAEAWRGLMGLDADPLRPESPPALSLTACARSGIALGRFRGTPARISRSRRVAADSGGNVVICIAADAPTMVRNARLGERAFAPGDAHVWLSDEPLLCAVEQPYSAMMVSLPRAMVAPAGLDTALRRGGLEGAAPGVRLLAGYAHIVADQLAMLTPDALDSAFSHLRELAILALCAAETPQARGPRAARLAAVKADIEAHLTAPALSPRWIAARHAMSERTLRTLFADTETNFSDFVRERRLALARRLLDDPRHDAQSVAQIAYASGFGDLSWFNRAFLRRFGMPPSEVRAARRRLP